MAAGTTPDRATDVVCPFCGLICDDLVVERDPSGLRVVANGCPLSLAGFARGADRATPHVGGKPASLEAAIARAAEILADSTMPVFAGLGADVAGLRAILSLADRLGGVVDHLASAALFRNLRTVQDDGWITTTLSEVRNRLDLLVIVGPGVASLFPRFYERCVFPAETLFGGDVRQRQIVLLGAAAEDVAAATEAARAAKAAEPVAIDCDPADLAAVVAALRALLGGRGIPESAAAGSPLAELEDLSGRMRAARYGVIAWVAAALEGRTGELVVGTICDMLRDLNQRTRFSGLPLAGADNGIGANQVCTWQTGLPLRTSFARGHPDHDAWRFDAARLAESGEADAIVWVSAFRDGDIPFGGEAPVVALGTPGSRFAREPEAFIPVGTPGLDHDGQVFRTDGVVALPVRGLRESTLPPVADVMAALAEAIPARPEPDRRAG